MYLRLATLVALIGLHDIAQAQHEHAVAAKIGFLGLGVEYTHRISDLISVRAGINGSQYGFDAVESGIAYDFDLIWDSLSVGVDFHPLKSPLRFSVGLLSNDNGLEAASRAAGNITVGGTTYTPAEVGTLRADVGFDSTAPVASFGWDWSRDRDRFGVSFDLGLVSQGSPRLRLTADGGLVGDAAFEADLAAEQSELQVELDDFDLFPFASLGFVFRF